MKPLITLMLTLGSFSGLEVGQHRSRRPVEYNPTSPMEHRGVSAALEVGAKLGLAALLNLRGRAWNY